MASQSVSNRAYLTRYKNLSRTLVLGTGDTPTTVGANFCVGQAGYTIYILSIRVHVLTAAAQAINFQDDASSPVVIATLPASETIGDEHVLLEDVNGPGTPLTEGKNLDITGTAGVGARIDVVAYLRPTGTLVGASKRTGTV